MKLQSVLPLTILLLLSCQTAKKQNKTRSDLVESKASDGEGEVQAENIPELVAQVQEAAKECASECTDREVTVKIANVIVEAEPEKLVTLAESSGADVIASEAVGEEVLLEEFHRPWVSTLTDTTTATRPESGALTNGSFWPLMGAVAGGAGFALYQMLKVSEFEQALRDSRDKYEKSMKIVESAARTSSVKPNGLALARGQFIEADLAYRLYKKLQVLSQSGFLTAKDHAFTIIDNQVKQTEEPGASRARKAWNSLKKLFGQRKIVTTYEFNDAKVEKMTNAEIDALVEKVVPAGKSTIADETLDLTRQTLKEHIEAVRSGGRSKSRPIGNIIDLAGLGPRTEADTVWGNRKFFSHNKLDKFVRSPGAKGLAAMGFGAALAAVTEASVKAGSQLAQNTSETTDQAFVRKLRRFEGRLWILKAEKNNR